MGRWISFAYDLDPNGHGGVFPFDRLGGDLLTRAVPNVPEWERYDSDAAKVFWFEDQGDARPGMHPDDVRLDSYVSGFVGPFCTFSLQHILSLWSGKQEMLIQRGLSARAECV